MLGLRLLVIFSWLQNVHGSISWLVVGMAGQSPHIHHDLPVKPAQICKELPGLTRRQIKFCRRNLDTMESIREGAKEAYEECQFQFQKRRWNCTMMTEDGHLFADAILKDGTREAAFVHAISAAGVAYRITKDCKRGRISKCGCDIGLTTRTMMPSRKYSYRGCSDNVNYGIAVSAEFVDAAEKQKNQSMETRMMNQHNNRAGREILASSIKTRCKCHGVSGACEVKTCWEELPEFREIATLLKDKFDGATEVEITRDEQNGLPIVERKNPLFKRHTSSDLIYLHPSHDYCEPDYEKGVLGTHGRPCNISNMALDSCDLLCCHRGYNLEVKTVQERCKCKFHYCCRVECQTCEKVVETYTCK
ncbi:unnamed protein product [Bursaphelenchus xylophilus]|uniref:Protein Wnt n=1 Tax=Bursaphelenchus xylophilus TaxID=6326 RepID=A0A1I7SWE5_BURXY|nr:unnamed protein product [Bursaphelenchus xylophilus]CAG9099281.1 unnamed protein product [Bursaphelenchus xylophilus]